MENLVDLIQRNQQALVTAGRVVLIVILAFVVRALLHRGTNRTIRSVLAGTVPAVVRPAIGRARGLTIVDDDTPLLTERRRQRAETIGSLLRSTTTAVVFTVAVAMILSELGFNLGPVLASAGIAGVALGFGAQNVVKDVLNGIFMILEDQYGVGDAIDAGEASGIVEAIGLRVTRLRSVDGTVWHVRNGEILRVGNMSQQWSRALLDISVAYGTDTDQAVDVIKSAADDVWHDDDIGHLVLEEPEVWGVENLGIDGVVIRLVVKTAPLEQWKVARELRRRLKTALDEAGIEIPFPQRTLWVRGSGRPGASSDEDSLPDAFGGDHVDSRGAPGSESTTGALQGSGAPSTGGPRPPAGPDAPATDTCGRPAGFDTADDLPRPSDDGAPTTGGLRRRAGPERPTTGGMRRPPGGGGGSGEVGVPP